MEQAAQSGTPSTVGEGLFKLGEDELVLGAVGEPLGGDDVGEVGDGELDTSNGDDTSSLREVVIPAAGGRQGHVEVAVWAHWRFHILDRPEGCSVGVVRSPAEIEH